MRSRSFSYLLVTLLSGGLLAQTLISAAGFNQAENPGFWYKPEKFTQPAKPKTGRVRPVSRPRPDSAGLEENPLLAVKYQVLKRGDANFQESVDPGGQFKIEDQLKLSLTPNQTGFLYVVHASVGVDGKVIDQPHVIFPDPRINGGQNAVEKDRAYIVPQYCPEFSDPKDCWWEITPPNGREFFTVIFSRDQIVADFPNKLTEEDVARGSSAISQQVIEALKKGSGQILAKDTGVAGSRRTKQNDGVYVRNTSLKDNEELIDTIEIKHLTGGDEQPEAMTRALFVKKRSDAMRVLFLKDGVPVDPSTHVFTSADEIEVKYESNFTGYAYFVNITPDGKKCLISPCSRADANEIVSGSEYKQTVGFDDEKGTEVLQVVLSRERIKFLEDAVKGDCCPCCELRADAASAAAQLASNASNKKGGLVVNDVVAVVPQSGSGGIRARGIKLAAGRDKNEGSFVSIDDQKNDNRLDAGQAAVF
ncbi:MAG TPA: DUF4384 domain-containing protein, partial [Blastocatellia bacterium]|nr:DUF4384 domain-containing protein [Blastocatellia bacterium]